MLQHIKVSSSTSSYNSTAIPKGQYTSLILQLLIVATLLGPVIKEKVIRAAVIPKWVMTPFRSQAILLLILAPV